MNRLRDFLCGNKDHDAQWEIVPNGTTLPLAQVERKTSRSAELHIPLKAAPKGDAKVEPLVVTVHLWLRNEW